MGWYSSYNKKRWQMVSMKEERDDSRLSEKHEECAVKKTVPAVFLTARDQYHRS